MVPNMPTECILLAENPSVVFERELIIVEAKEKLYTVALHRESLASNRW